MKIVIDISEKALRYFNEIIPRTTDVYVVEAASAIANGTPLPKGHGRLVDEKDLSLLTVHLIDGVFVCNAPTIIEADKE